MRGFFAEIFANKVRVLLTMLAIAWGTVAILIMLAVGQGLLLRLTQLLDQMGAHVLVIVPGVRNQSFEGVVSSVPISLKQRDGQLLSTLPGVQEVAPEYASEVTLAWHDKQLNQSLSAVSGNYQRLRHITLKPGGRFINQLDNQQKKKVVVLGFKVAERLFSPIINPIGQIVQINKVPFEVIGLTRTHQQLMQYQTADDYLIWMPASVFHVLQPTTPLRYLLLKYDETMITSQQLKRSIRQLLSLHHHFNWQDKSALYFLDNHETVTQTQHFFRGLQWFLGMVGGLTLLISSIGIANIMLVAVQRAIPFIGLRMACGALPRQILWRYLCQAWLIISLGASLGVGVVEIIILFMNPFLKNIAILGVTGFKLHLSWPMFAVVASVLIIMGGLAGFFPALKAARVQPVEALRYE